MNLLVGAPMWLLVLLACALIGAAIEDAARLRISNLISLAVLLGAVIAAILLGYGPIWKNIVAFAAVLLLGTIAFAAGWLGGGDVKLLAACAAWLDFTSAVWFLAFVFLAGGLVTIFYLLTRRMTRSRRENESPARVPYGIAIALGAFALLLIDRGSGSVERSLPPVHLSDDDVRDSAGLSMLVHAGDASRDAGHLDAVQRS